MTVIYTFDVFSSLDAFGSAVPGSWGGYWGKQGPGLLDRRLALYGERQRMAFGANTYRLFAHFLASATEESEVHDAWVTRMTGLPATVVSRPRADRQPDTRRQHPGARLPARPACLRPSMNPRKPWRPAIHGANR